VNALSLRSAEHLLASWSDVIVHAGEPVRAGARVPRHAARARRGDEHRHELPGTVAVQQDGGAHHDAAHAAPRRLAHVILDAHADARREVGLTREVVGDGFRPGVAEHAGRGRDDHALAGAVERLDQRTHGAALLFHGEFAAAVRRANASGSWPRERSTFSVREFR